MPEPKSLGWGWGCCKVRAGYNVKGDRPLILSSSGISIFATTCTAVPQRCRDGPCRSSPSIQPKKMGFLVVHGEKGRK